MPHIGTRRLILLWACLWFTSLHAQERVTVAYPGPFALPYLPLDVAQKMGADKAEGIQIIPRHTTGGGPAVLHLEKRNADFAIAGIGAAMSAKAGGSDVAAIAAINDLPVFVVTVRSDLRNQVKRPRDLAGRVIGVTSGAIRSMPHQFAELMLKSYGLSPNQVRIVAVGQSWEEQSAVLRSKSADALVGIEPFASRLRDAGLAFPLFNLGNPADAARIPGAGFLQASLVTRGDILREAPANAEKMVATIRRTLQWMTKHGPQKIVEILEIPDPEVRMSLLKTLQQYPRLYSPDGMFSDRQIAETNRFYAAANHGRKPLQVESLIDARWAGRKP